MRDLDLSYDCLTGTAVRSKLRDLRDTDPAFWDELTLKDSERLLPPENVRQAEDEHDDTSDHVDDSDVPIDVLIKNIVADVAPRGYTVGVWGGFQAEADAETFEDKPAPKLDEGDNAVGELGRGKRRKQPNQLYAAFWWHNDSDVSDAENS